MGPQSQGTAAEDADEFYKRTVLWKKWREETNVRMSRDRAAAEAAGCTFTPALNATSQKMVAEGLRYPVKDILAVAAQSTPAPSAGAARRARSAPRGASGAPSPLLHSLRASREPTGEPRSPLYYDTITVRNDPAIVAPSGSSLLAGVMPGGGGSGAGGSAAGSDAATAATSAQLRACNRLYSLAQQQTVRRDELRKLGDALAKEVTRWSAPRGRASRDVAPRLYDHLSREPVSPSKIREAALAAELAECTFFPKTNVRSKTPPPGSARGGGGSSDRSPSAGPSAAPSIASPRSYRAPSSVAAGSDVSQARDTYRRVPSAAPSTPRGAAAAGGGGAAGRRTPTPPPAARANHDLDFNEFLERQARFLSSKAQHVDALAEAAATRPTTHLAPGTERILKRAKSAGRGRDQDGGAAAAAAAGAPEWVGGRPGALSAPRQRRGAPEESSFRPQITRMAQRMAPRDAHQMSEGERCVSLKFCAAAPASPLPPARLPAPPTACRPPRALPPPCRTRPCSASCLVPPPAAAL